MQLYLVQHAEAKQEDEDPARGLSDKGLSDIQKVAAYVAQRNLNVDRILHSTKLRAEQTAQVLAKHLKTSDAVAKTDGLAPLDDPAVWISNLNNISGDVMLVGHLPHLSRLASLLLSGDSERKIISFSMAGIVCLESGGDSGWSLKWMITPELVC